jgi:hypothetical protein
MWVHHPHPQLATWLTGIAIPKVKGEGDLTTLKFTQEEMKKKRESLALYMY